MKPGTEIRTTDRVFSAEGFIPAGTHGKVLLAVSENGYRIEFTNVEIQTGVGTKMINTVTTVLTSHLTEAAKCS